MSNVVERWVVRSTGTQEVGLPVYYKFYDNRAAAHKELSKLPGMAAHAQIANVKTIKDDQGNTYILGGPVEPVKPIRALDETYYKPVILRFLDLKNACGQSRRFVLSHRSMKGAYYQATSRDWLIWLYEATGLRFSVPYEMFGHGMSYYNQINHLRTIFPFEDVLAAMLMKLHQMEPEGPYATQIAFFLKSRN
jgi:hypothetical protein